MSDYRDDIQDTAIASNKVFGGLRSAVDEVLRISDALIFGIAITLSSTAIASDEVIDSTTYVFNDSATIAGEIVDRKQSKHSLSDRAKLSERWQHNLLAITNDSAAISDELPEGYSTGSLTVDSIKASDSVTSQRIVQSIITDKLTISETLTAISRDLTTDAVQAGDKVADKLRATQSVTDNATASDEQVYTSSYLITDKAKVSDEIVAKRNVVSMVIDGVKASDKLIYRKPDLVTDSATVDSELAGTLHAVNTIIDSTEVSSEVLDSIIQHSSIVDTVTVSDDVLDTLHASVTLEDIAVIEDQAINTGGYYGQAWTANVDSWAMSRYNPYNFKRLVVIDNVLYGEADDGIYRLDEAERPVVASIKTGKMDLGRGALTHPSTAYLEYELDGNASMTVHTTQKGVAQQYTYVLPNEVADELTNGRFIFGRGLRGRHFSFELTMIGTHGHVNDLSIEHMPTSRRV